MPTLAKSVRLAALYYTVRDCTIRLFVNDHTPTDEDTLDNYIEANFPGYAPIATKFDDWQVSGLVLNYPPQLFQLTADLDTRVTVYGWLLARGNDFVMGHRDAKAPHKLMNKGSVIKVPNVTIGDKGG